MVTAELAVCLPVLLLLVAAALSMVAISAANVRALDAAREGARAEARGAGGAGVASRVAPGARVSMDAAGDTVVAQVSLTVHPLGGWLPAVTVTQSAVAEKEPVPP